MVAIHLGVAQNFRAGANRRSWSLFASRPKHGFHFFEPQPFRTAYTILVSDGSPANTSKKWFIKPSKWCRISSSTVSLNPSVCQSTIHLKFYQSFCTCLPGCMPGCLPACLPACLAVYLSTCQTICMRVTYVHVDGKKLCKQHVYMS